MDKGYNFTYGNRTYNNWHLDDPKGREKLEKDIGPDAVAYIMSAFANQLRISELHGLLADTDYKAIKYAEGQISAEEYAETKTQRQAWRTEINALEAQIIAAAPP